MFFWASCLHQIALIGSNVIANYANPFRNERFDACKQNGLRDFFVYITIQVQTKRVDALRNLKWEED